MRILQVCGIIIVLIGIVHAIPNSIITKVETITNTTIGKGYVFVRVTLSDGTEGIGQCGNPWKDPNEGVWMVGLFHDAIAKRAVGEDANELAAVEQKIWDKYYKNSGELFFRALAGFDTAVFDALAKQANLTVCNFIRKKLNLSATPCPSTFPIYGSSMSRTVKPDDLAKKLVDRRDKYGVTAFKIKIAQRMGHNIDVYPNRSEEVVSAARAALGPDIPLMVDANSGYTDIAHAGPIAQMLAKYNVSWFEEPCVWNNLRCARQVFDLNIIPVALGEQEYRLYEDWRNMLDVQSDENDIFGGSWQKLSQNFVGKTSRNYVQRPDRTRTFATHIAQPDIGYVGGLTRALQVSAWAANSGLQFGPHNPGESMNFIFTLQLMAALPPSVAVPWIEYGCVDQHPPKGIFKPEIVLKDGQVTLPQASGWGVTLNFGSLADVQIRATP